MEKIIKNAVQCLECNDIIESESRWDFKFCSCGNIAVDGGTNYLRRVGHGITKKTYKDLSVTEVDTTP